MPTAEQIIQQIRQDPKIPAPSQTVFKVLELTKDRECDIGKVAAVISRDGGLTAQLLRQANSALYGFDSPTSSIPDACMRLGLKRVRTAVINQHVVSGLGKARPPGFDANRYWQAAFATSVAAQDLCKELAAASIDDAGTAGLLCDIGVGLMAFGVPGLYGAVLSQASRPPARDLAATERRLLGVTHAEVGAAVLMDWGLDEHVIEAIRFHHMDPLEPAEVELGKFTRIVAAAVTLSGIALDGTDMGAVSVLFGHVDALTSDADGLVSRLLDQLVAHIQGTAQSYAVELGSVDQMQANFDELIRDMPDVGKNMSYRPLPKDMFAS